MHISVSRSWWVNTLRPRQIGRHFPDDIFKCIFLNEFKWISIEISLKFVPKGPINNTPALVQIMAWRRPGDTPLSEPMLVCLLTQICVTRPQWVKKGVRNIYRCQPEPTGEYIFELPLILYDLTAHATSPWWTANNTWSRHQMEIFSVLQRPVTRSFYVFFDLHLNKRLSKQKWDWWCETPWCSLWHHRNEGLINRKYNWIEWSILP